MQGKARRGARKIEILRSAVAAFRRRGFHGASMDQIARALGMQKGNLYRAARQLGEARILPESGEDFGLGK